MMTDRDYRFRGIADALLLLAALAALIAGGCRAKDETLTAAPPPRPGAQAPPPTQFEKPRQRLPPLVSKGGQRTGADL